MNIRTPLVAVGLLVIAAPVAAPVRAAGASPTTCERIASLTLPNTTITLATTVAAGSFTPPAGRQGRGAAVYSGLPSFCRVAATLTPSTDSDVKIEVWLP